METSRSVTWLYHWPPTGAVAFRLGRSGDVLVAEWPTLGTLQAEATGLRSEFTPKDEAAPHVRERLGEAVAALLRHLRRGDISLHASCVSRAGVAVACLGDSGAGKSTLAARLCADPSVALLSDDIAALRLEGSNIEVEPAEGSHWLRPDMARAMGLDPHGQPKVAVKADRYERDPVRLGAIVNLCTDDDVAVPLLRRLKGRDAFFALSFATLRYALDIPEVTQREFDNLAHVAREVPVYELRRRQDAVAMEACYPVVNKVLRELEERGNT